MTTQRKPKDPEARLNDLAWIASDEGQRYLEEHRKAERKRREWERRTAGRIR